MILSSQVRSCGWSGWSGRGYLDLINWYGPRWTIPPLQELLVLSTRHIRTLLSIGSSKLVTWWDNGCSCVVCWSTHYISNRNLLILSVNPIKRLKPTLNCICSPRLLNPEPGSAYSSAPSVTLDHVSSLCNSGSLMLGQWTLASEMWNNKMNTIGTYCTAHK